ncbi:MAG TPA: hypothetical protein VGE74_27640, partial [Gemmata sp.]
GVLSGGFAFLVSLAALWVALFPTGERGGLLFYNLAGMVSAFATLGGLCFVGAAIARHAEQPSPRYPRSSDGPARS